MLLDGDHLLLADKAVPAAQRLGVVRRICVIGSHVLAHDPGGVARDVEAGLEPVLQPHAGDGLRRSEEHTSELQSLMRISYAVFCLKKHKQTSARDTQDYM